MNTSTILVVDDEIEYLNLLKSILEDEGYKNVLTLDNPHKVIRTLQENKIDLVLLDVYMPGLNGLDVLENISRQNPQVPVIMVTAVDELEIALKAIKLGAYEFIVKPIDTERLFLTIVRALEKRVQDLELDSLRKPLIRSRERKKYFDDIVTNSPQMHLRTNE
jgi:DNA-binding NtrC family response regulator